MNKSKVGYVFNFHVLFYNTTYTQSRLKLQNKLLNNDYITLYKYLNAVIDQLDKDN